MISKQTKILANEVRVGKSLPWSAYDGQGRLLLTKGTIIQSQRQLDSLLNRGLYRRPGSEKKQPPTPVRKEQVSPFVQIVDFSERLKGIFLGLKNKTKGTPDRVLNLANDIHKMCAEDFDAALGAVHLVHEIDYVLSHPIHVAVLCELVAEFNKYDIEHRQILIASALTANIGMLNLQTQLFRQQAPLSPEQRQKVRDHPLRSAEILKAAGVDNETWLTTVLQHHEHSDGSGYQGIKGDEIQEDAKIIVLADRYSAMVSPRAHRISLTASDSLKSLFLGKGKEHDEVLSLSIIKLLGVFPPGSFVRLINGEIAVVIKRPVTGMWPIVKSIVTPRGGPFGEPLTRDCNEDLHSIKELYVPENLPPFNYSAMWGDKN